jgi:transglutaminase-like putative cysteine protease
MSWLEITHDTIYGYQKAVRFGPHRLVLRPREGHDVRIEEIRVQIEPEFELEWSRDLFGNCVATAHILSPAEHLRIYSKVLLHQTAPFPQRSTRRDTSTSFPVQFSEIESAVAAAYLATTYPTDVAKVKEWSSATIDPAAVHDAEEIVASLARRIRKTIKYRRREAKGVQSPSQTLSAGSGSCRDMATLMLEALRSMGFPARFATGYLVGSASDAGHASTHAWAEAYLPSVGWIGYDPMLGEATSGNHIVAGVSNHPRGVMPVTGTYFDEHKSYLGMKVAVQTSRFADLETASRSFFSSQSKPASMESIFDNVSIFESHSPKIVSGGQTGADRAALDWALSRDIECGGWCPKDRKAEDGEIAEKYPLMETPSASYGQRTEWNVRDTDGTVVISTGPVLNGGSKKTVEFARQQNKPCLHIHSGQPEAVQSFREFISDNEIATLNVAGPRASEEPAVGQFVREVLEQAFPDR